MDLPKHVTMLFCGMRNGSRFYLRAHTLVVKSSLWRNGKGYCDKCSCAAVQNEVHVLFTVKTCVCFLKEKCSIFAYAFASHPT